MYASELVKRARSLANIPKAQYIDHEDEVESLYESYKDLYTKFTDAAAYDYFITGPVDLDMTTAVKTGQTEWVVDLPDDVWKLRYVDYNRNGYWNNMPLFNINQRNQVGGEPKYRWLGKQMWINGTLPPQVRIRYYQPPMVPSVPDVSYQYALQYPQYQLPAVDAPQYFSLPDPVNEGDNDYCLYVYGGDTLMLESYSLNTEQTLVVAAGISQAQYWLGYIYYLQAGDIWRATTNLTSLSTPTKITSSANILNFSITSNNKLFWSSSSNTYIANLDGTSPVVKWAYATSDVCLYTGGYYAYIKTLSNTIYVDTYQVCNAQTYGLTTDTVYLYYLDANGAIHRLTLDNGNNYAQIGDFQMYSGMQYLGSWWGNRFAVVDNQYNVKAVSTYIDSEFVYPLNEAFEIMAFQSAVDYKRKASGDTTALEARLAQIWARFEDVLRRDQGQPERRIADSQYSATPWFY